MKYRIQLLSIWSLLIVFGFSAQAETSKSINSTNEYKSVLNLLDLTQPELKEVRNAYLKEEYTQAAEHLLEYYRSRAAIENVVDRSRKQNALGKGINKTDQKWADDALEHKFVGQKNYPSYFLGEDIDWLTNPVSDKEWIWQLHRMYWWPSMGKAYWNSGDEKYAKEWVFQLCDWIKKNPYKEGDWLAWRPLEVGSRISSLTKVFEYFVESPYFTADVLMTFLSSYHEQVTYVTEHYSPVGNHALFEGEGVMYGGVCFHEFKDAARWRKSAAVLFNREIKKQVFADGMHFELSTSYHAGAIQTFLSALIIAESNGYNNEFPASYSKTIEKMIEANYTFSLPDFTVAQFGDAWKGSPTKLSNFFKKLVKHYPREDFVYFATKGKEGQPPKQTSIALKNAGFYTMRSGWGEYGTCMVLKCGPEGFFHAQPDNGGFELYAKGRHFMPDSGCYIYSGDEEWRNWFRRTASHQTLTLNNENSASKPNLLIWDSSEKMDTLVIENQSYENLTHRRAVFFNKEFFVIVDDAIGTAQGDLRLHYSFEPCDAVFNGMTARTNFTEGANLLVQTMAQEGLTLEQESGWVSYEYHKKIERPAFSYKIEKSSKTRAKRFVTVILPYQGKQPTIKINQNGRAGSPETKVQIEIDGHLHDFAYNLRN